jgi:hypothetical protein
MFAMGTIKARERGVEHNLQMQWVGKNKMENWTVDNTELSSGQLILVFVCFTVAFFSSLAILGFEMAYIFIKSRWELYTKTARIEFKQNCVGNRMPPSRGRSHQ